MDKNFASIAFSPAVKELQQKWGSRTAYARMEKNSDSDGLTQNEIEFIADRDSFYIASIGENGYPYIQHRGGPPGFLKVLDAKRLAFIDFKGNLQYITAGNLATHQNVSLMMMDYAARARLKIFAKAEILPISDDPALYQSLDLPDYSFKGERIFILHVQAYDWNCPQHITPRYTAEQIQEAFAPQQKRIAELEEALRKLQAGISPGEQL